MKRLTLVLALALTAAGAQAHFRSGNALLEELKQNGTSRRMFSMGYVTAIHDATFEKEQCSPRGVTIGQIVAVAQARLEANPENLHMTARSLVGKAFAEAWPLPSREQAMKRALILAAALVASAAQAQFVSGNVLLEYMNKTDQTDARAFVAGVHDAGLAEKFCPPGGVTIEQVFDLTRRVLDKVPEHRHGPAVWYVEGALIAAFPCKKKPAATPSRNIL